MIVKSRTISLIITPLILSLLCHLIVGQQQPQQDVCTQHQCPDLATISIRDLSYENDQGEERIRFTNGIANLGPGYFQVRSSVANGGNTSAAVQELINSSGAVVWSKQVGQMDYSPDNNNYHVERVATYTLLNCPNDVTVPTNTCSVVSTANKISYCLMDTFNFVTGSTESNRYSSCDKSYQGISPQWVDLYESSLVDQWVVITGIQAGKYFLTSKVNMYKIFQESNYENNGAWVPLTIGALENGKRIIAVQPCSNCGTTIKCYMDNCRENSKIITNKGNHTTTSTLAVQDKALSVGGASEIESDQSIFVDEDAVEVMDVDENIKDMEEGTLVLEDDSDMEMNESVEPDETVQTMNADPSMMDEEEEVPVMENEQGFLETIESEPDTVSVMGKSGSTTVMESKPDNEDNLIMLNDDEVEDVSTNEHDAEIAHVDAQSTRVTSVPIITSKGEDAPIKANVKPNTVPQSKNDKEMGSEFVSAVEEIEGGEQVQTVSESEEPVEDMSKDEMVMDVEEDEQVIDATEDVGGEVLDTVENMSIPTESNAATMSTTEKPQILTVTSINATVAKTKEEEEEAVAVKNSQTTTTSS